MKILRLLTLFLIVFSVQKALAARKSGSHGKKKSSDLCEPVDFKADDMKSILFNTLCYYLQTNDVLCPKNSCTEAQNVARNAALIKDDENLEETIEASVIVDIIINKHKMLKKSKRNARRKLIKIVEEIAKRLTESDKKFNQYQKKSIRLMETLNTLRKNIVMKGNEIEATVSEKDFMGIIEKIEKSLNENAKKKISEGIRKVLDQKHPVTFGDDSVWFEVIHDINHYGKC